MGQSSYGEFSRRGAHNADTYRAQDTNTKYNKSKWHSMPVRIGSGEMHHEMAPDLALYYSHYSASPHGSPTLTHNVGDNSDYCAVLNEQFRCGDSRYLSGYSRTTSVDELMRYSPFTASSYTKTESSIDLESRPLLWTRKPWTEIQKMQYTQSSVRQEIVALKARELQKREMDYFAELPVEMVYHLFQYLAVSDVVRMASVCKYFRSLLYNPAANGVLWKRVYNAQFGEHESSFVEYYHHKRTNTSADAQMWRKICINAAQQMSWRLNNTSQLLNWAAENGHWRVLRQARLQESLTMTEINRLMISAAGEGHVECVNIISDVLLLSGYGLEGNVGATRGRRGRPFTALLKAALHGHAAVVALLVNKGADVNAKDHWDETSCLKAARRGRRDVLEILLTQTVMPCDIHATNSDGDDALMVAARAGDAKCADLLLAHGALVSPAHQVLLVLLRQVPQLATVH
eukprot:TRINITY_DN4188_c0_g1_i1.p1 TRINITY_DN4188_c0_g1~~TRINITY_DN4188_c0_g1_i1.p1  ORF type:complete len:460 (+),score=32.10 TRINITY_DN4188_c0_g1_i1:149-1528(+)